MNFKSLLSLTFCLMATVVVSAQKASPQPSWLSDAVVYQIYPSSYQDSEPYYADG